MHFKCQSPRETRARSAHPLDSLSDPAFQPRGGYPRDRIEGGSFGADIVPAATVHSFKNVGATPACMLDWTLPGGQDRYFKKISELAAGGSFTGDKLAELNKEHNTTFVPHADR